LLACWCPMYLYISFSSLMQQTNKLVSLLGEDMKA